MAIKILAALSGSALPASARAYLSSREARVGAQLQHENLVRIYDFGESHGRHFLVMEYIEGKTIATLIFEQGPMPPATAVRLVRHVALGLEHAHRKGLIHRDVNPYNILVTRDGTAKLADLGLAIAMAEEDRVTRDGATVGTFDYVAPEQARNSRAADIRSDIYSLGCTIYQMCTADVPFPDRSLPEKLFAHQSIDPTPLCRTVRGIPEGLSKIVERMMRKSPDERYATPLQVAQALEPYADEFTGIGNGEGRPPRLEPLLIEPAPPIVHVAHRHGAKSALTLVDASGPETRSRVATNPDSGHDADDDAPLLTPDDDAHETDEVRLILDLDPQQSMSGDPPRSEPRSSTDDSASADVAAQPPTRLAPSWLWGLIVLAVTVMALVIILATV